MADAHSILQPQPDVAPEQQGDANGLAPKAVNGAPPDPWNDAPEPAANPAPSIDW
jgi:hypothetical protein